MQFWNRRYPYQGPELLVALQGAATTIQTTAQPAIQAGQAALTTAKDFLSPVIDPVVKHGGEFLGGFTGDTTAGLVTEAVPGVVGKEAVFGRSGEFFTEVLTPAVAGIPPVPATYTTAASLGRTFGQMGDLAQLGTGIAMASGAFAPDIPQPRNLARGGDAQRAAEELAKKRAAGSKSRIVTGARDRRTGARLGGRYA